MEYFGLARIVVPLSDRYDGEAFESTNAFDPTNGREIGIRVDLSFSDTKAPLSVVSSKYQVVQPETILEFYRDFTEVGGFKLETAGVLKDGKKL